MPSLRESLRPRPVTLPIDAYGYTGTLCFHSLLCVEANFRSSEYRVEYECRAVLSRPDASSTDWTLESLRGTRVDGRGGFTPAAHRNFRRHIPSMCAFWMETLPPGGLIRVQAEHALTDAEGTASLIRQLDELIEEIPRQADHTIAAKERELEPYRVIAHINEWARGCIERNERWMVTFREQMQAQIALVRQTRQEIIDRFREANTF